MVEFKRLTRFPPLKELMKSSGHLHIDSITPDRRHQDRVKVVVSGKHQSFTIDYPTSDE